MKRLFMVMGTADHTTVYFDNKADAKILRDERVRTGVSAWVSKGLDHADFGVVRPSSIHPKRKRKEGKL